MIKEQAKVTNISDTDILLSSAVKSACAQCHQNETCGSGQIAKAIPHKTLSISLPKSHVPSDLTLNIGDTVEVGLSEKHLLSTAFEVYTLPLLGLMLFGFIGQWLMANHIFTSELFAILISFAGGYLGFKIASFRQAKKQGCQEARNHLLPQILRVISENSLTNQTQVITVTPDKER